MPLPIDGLMDLSGLQLPASNAAAAGDLGQQEFFELMLTQLKNQDPFKPLESGEFLSQIAQFSSVQSLGQLNSSFATLSSSIVANQALQGAALVGRSVLMAGPTIHPITWVHPQETELFDGRSLEWTLGHLLPGDVAPSRLA